MYDVFFSFQPNVESSKKRARPRSIAIFAFESFLFSYINPDVSKAFHLLFDSIGLL